MAEEYWSKDDYGGQVIDLWNDGTRRLARHEKGTKHHLIIRWE